MRGYGKTKKIENPQAGNAKEVLFSQQPLRFLLGQSPSNHVFRH